MKKITLGFIVALSSLVLSGCQSSNQEVNRCGQELFQCQQNCDMKSAGEGLVQSVCEIKCTERHNQCKKQAETLIQAEQAQ
ncbi:hypothetical protein PULV_a1993 [Pseudoalteromonas ulvae UL12]|uniref:Orphan protein n=1 Tax=Pseudoalteromonas ulvae TaxID=107327 RepID=A0A244CQ83_PSEDV|nr:hypothetical protein [Pseudoalteromonas ulvae]MBE0365231.1 hypothetical protein [Pseudoalteromonas ulvae UL12]OUL57771.1 hypothetical protein B1199_12005 [Pseudoalteromonas ulvae]